MIFTAEVPLGLGEAVGNMLRQAAYVGSGGWRPIGFSIKGVSSTILTAKSIVEDMVYVNSQISGLTYSPTLDSYDDDFYVVTVDKSYSPITSTDIASSTDMFNISGEECTIVTCTDQSSPIRLELYMHYSNGIHFPEENRKVLKEHGYLTGQAISIVSMHSWFKRIGFEVHPTDIVDRVTFNIEPMSGTGNHSELIKQFCDLVASIFGNMGNIIE